MLAENFNTDQDSPLGRAEALYYAVADAQPYAQIASGTGTFQSSCQEALHTILPGGEGMEGRLTKKLWSDDCCPLTPEGDFSTTTDSEEELISHRTAGYRKLVQRSDMNPNLARIGETVSVSGGKKPKHRTISCVRHVIGSSAGGEQELSTET